MCHPSMSQPRQIAKTGNRSAWSLFFAGNLEQFKEAVKPVWQFYIDEEYFSWEDINTMLEIILE